MAGATAYGFIESRSDGIASKTAYAVGYQLAGGVMILLSFLDSKAAWSAYDSAGIRHTYLTAEVAMMNALFGDVGYSSIGISGGLTFEF